MADSEYAKPSLWKEWYPPITPDYVNTPLGESVYGPPINKTIELFKTIPHNSKIWDIGGGDGRYAIPLSHMGHNIYVSDIDQEALRKLIKNTAGSPPHSGKIVPVFADATTPSPFSDESVDAVLNSGFGYLIPPDGLDSVFKNMAQALKPKGLFVFEFAANRIREEFDTGKSLIGEKEYNYTREEGLETLERLGIKYGIEFRPPIEEHRDVKLDYRLIYDLILAHGIKKNNKK
jgi:SAM-dependent methyltransferase